MRIKQESGLLKERSIEPIYSRVRNNWPCATSGAAVHPAAGPLLHANATQIRETLKKFGVDSQLENVLKAYMVGPPRDAFRVTK